MVGKGGNFKIGGGSSVKGGSISFGGSSFFKAGTLIDDSNTTGGNRGEWSR